MKSKDRVQHLDQQIANLKAQLQELADMRPGSLSRQYNVCGKSGCRCKDPKRPKRHGPYYQLNYVYGGKKTSEFVRPADLAQIGVELATFKKFRRLTNRWVGLALKRAKLKLSLPAA